MRYSTEMLKVKDSYPLPKTMDKSLLTPQKSQQVTPLRLPQKGNTRNS